MYSFSLRTFSYSSFDMSKTCLFEELFDKRLLIDFGSYFILCGGWFDEVLTCSNWSFGFLYGLYVPSNKLNATFKKSTICKLVFVSILKPAFLRIFYYAFSYSVYFLFGCISQKNQSVIPVQISRLFIKFI